MHTLNTEMLVKQKWKINFKNTLCKVGIDYLNVSAQITFVLNMYFQKRLNQTHGMTNQGIHVLSCFFPFSKSCTKKWALLYY